MRVAVYCGSRDGADPKYRKAARKLGEWIGTNGHTLVYGAGCVGIMGELSRAVQESGGHIIGVIPQFMVDAGWEKKDLTRIEESQLPRVLASWDTGSGIPDGASPQGAEDVLLITSSMSTRKAKMMELAEVYIALPGGPGTLEEIAEVISLAAVGQHGKPCILLNQDGYYEPLRRMYERMLDQEFTEEANLVRVHYAADVEEVLRIAQAG